MVQVQVEVHTEEGTAVPIWAEAPYLVEVTRVWVGPRLGTDPHHSLGRGAHVQAEAPQILL